MQQQISNILGLLTAVLIISSCGTQPLHAASDYQTLGSQCTGGDRTNHLYQSNHSFAAQWESCSRDTWANGPETAQCLVKAFPDFTANCAQCIGDYAACTKGNCLLKCTFGSDESCKECSQVNCAPTLAACTGVSWEQLPSKG